MRINSVGNASLISSRMLQGNNKMSNSMSKLSSGKRVNKASDSPSEMLRISRGEAEIRGKQAARKNIQDGIALTRVAESALSEMNGIAHRLRDLSVQYGNDILTNEDRGLIEEETEILLKEMTHIKDNTKYNEKQIFKEGSFTLQTGAYSGENITIDMPKLNIPDGTSSYEEDIIAKHYKASVKDGCMSSAASDLVVKKDSDGKFLIEGTMNKKAFSGHYTVSDKGADYKISYGRNDYTGKLNVDESGFLREGEQLVGSRGSYGRYKTVLINSEVTHEEKEITTSGSSISELLNSDTIDRELLNPLAEARAYLGMKENALEIRLSNQISDELIKEEALSNI